MDKRFHLIVTAFLNICFLNLLKLSVAVTGIMMVLAQPLSAQDAEGGIKGMVRDAVSMIPLDRVNIIVLETTVGAVSDNNGRYTISGLQSGEYYIRGSMVGYESLQMPVQVTTFSALSIVKESGMIRPASPSWKHSSWSYGGKQAAEPQAPALPSVSKSNAGPK